MKHFLKEYFSFSKKERNGVIVLITIIIVLIVLLKMLPFFYEQEGYDFTDFENEISAFENEIIFELDSDFTSVKKYDFEPFYFDPNSVSEEKWRLMGLSEKVISTINNYKKKGGRFYSVEDITKIYGFPNELYLKIKDYIQIKGKERKKLENTVKSSDNKKDSSFYWSSSFADTSVIDINNITREEMIHIRNLPYNLIDRIIKYRTLLGGFYCKEQLKEVYGMDENFFKGIEDKIYIDKTGIRKININIIDFKDLLKHPYFEYENVRLITNFRKNYPIETMNDLLRNNLISDEQAQKLESYIQFGNE